MADLAQDVEDAILDTGTPAGTIRSTINVVADPGWELGNQTIVGCQTLYPALWAASPAGMKSGSDLVIPNLAELSMIGAGSFASLGQVAGANTQSIIEANLPSHDHSLGSHDHSLGSHTHAGGSLTAADAGAHSHNAGSADGFVRWFGQTMDNVSFASGSAGAAPAGGGGEYFDEFWTTSSASDHGHTISGTSAVATGNTGLAGTGNTGTAGSGTALNVVGKSYGVTFQIKAH